MGVFEEIVVKTKEMAEAAGKKTGEIVELSKLKINAAELSSQIRRGYVKLGKLNYDAVKGGVNSDELIKNEIARIDGLYSKLAEINEKLDCIKSVLRCPSCEASNPPDSAYCNKCGAVLIEDTGSDDGNIPDVDDQP